MTTDEKVKIVAESLKETLMILESLVLSVQSKYRVDLQDLASDLADQRDKLYEVIHSAS